MVIDLTPEQEALVLDAARVSGRSAKDMLTEAALWLAQMDGAQDESLKRSIEQADRGEFLSEEEVDARFQRLIAPR